MILGIMSDTHDNLDNLRKALDVFNARNVQHIIHAGDYTSPFTWWKVLKDFKGGFTGVFGNNDGDRVFLNRVFHDKIYPQPYVFALNDRKIVVMHEPDVADALADSGHFDLVVFGHIHEPVMKKVRDTLVVNPGEVGGWLYDKPTVAVVDLKTMEGELIRL